MENFCFVVLKDIRGKTMHESFKFSVHYQIKQRSICRCKINSKGLKALMLIFPAHANSSNIMSLVVTIQGCESNF